jgi:uncharacterized hydrophobic protein (TIGR00271 family)
MGVSVACTKRSRPLRVYPVAVLYLRAYVPTDRVADVIGALGGLEDVRHVVRMGTSAGGDFELISADVATRSGDEVLETLDRLGVVADEISITRENAAGPVERGRQRWLGSEDSLVWAEVVDTARDNARLFAQYLVFMAIAGIIAAIGVIGKNGILIVGAMAVSPDLLPVSAACVGIVGRRPRLIARAVATLIIGLVLSIVTAWLITHTLLWNGYLAPDFEVGTGVIGILATVNVTTFIIAFVAGIAGMLAFETRASAAVGVAISVTTIPAAAYAGVTLALAQSHAAAGAFAVLSVNVVMLLTGGTLTLAIQRLVNAPRAPGARVPADGTTSN